MSSKTAGRLKRLDAEAQAYIRRYPVREVTKARIDASAVDKQFETTQHPDPGCPSWEIVPNHHEEPGLCFQWFEEYADPEHDTVIKRAAGGGPMGSMEWTIRHGHRLIGQDAELHIAMLEAAVNLAKQEEES